MHARLESLVAAVVALIDALDAAGLEYAFGGAIALSAWSEPRATTDIDLNLWVDLAKLDLAFDALRASGVVFDADAARAKAEATGMFDGKHGSYRVDVFVPSIEFYEEARRTRCRITLAERPTWVLSAESLAVFKMLFFRAKDVVDVRRMLEVIGVAFDRGFVRRWLVATVEEDDPRVERWDALSAEVAV